MHLRNRNLYTKFNIIFFANMAKVVLRRNWSDDQKLYWNSVIFEKRFL